MTTKGQAFVETAHVRRGELAIMRRWFASNPNEPVSRADVAAIIGKPQNHATRIVDDLYKEGYIVYAFDAPSKHSRRKVEYVRFAGVSTEPIPAEPPPQRNEPKEQKITQLELFPL